MTERVRERGSEVECVCVERLIKLLWLDMWLFTVGQHYFFQGGGNKQVEGCYHPSDKPRTRALHHHWNIIKKTPVLRGVYVPVCLICVCVFMSVNVRVCAHLCACLQGAWTFQCNTIQLYMTSCGIVHSHYYSGTLVQGLCLIEC